MLGLQEAIRVQKFYAGRMFSPQGRPCLTRLGQVAILAVIFSRLLTVNQQVRTQLEGMR